MKVMQTLLHLLFLVVLAVLLALAGAGIWALGTMLAKGHSLRAIPCNRPTCDCGCMEGKDCRCAPRSRAITLWSQASAAPVPFASPRGPKPVTRDEVVGEWIGKWDGVACVYGYGSDGSYWWATEQGSALHGTWSICKGELHVCERALIEDCEPGDFREWRVVLARQPEGRLAGQAKCGGRDAGVLFEKRRK